MSAQDQPFADDSPSAFNSLWTVTETVEKVSMLEKTLADRTQQANDAEQRLAKRLEIVAKAEESIKALCEALRRQVAEGAAMLSQVATHKEQAKAVIGQTIKVAEGQLAKATAQLEERSAALQAADEEIVVHLAQLRNQATEVVGPACEELLSAVERARKEAEQAGADLPGRIARELESARSQLELAASAAVSAMDERSRSIELAASVIGDSLRQATDEAVSSAVAGFRVEADAHKSQALSQLSRQAQETQEQLRRQMDIAQRAAGDLASTLKADIEAQRAGILRQITQNMEGQLAEAREEFDRQSAAALAGVRGSIRNQVQSLEDEARLAIRPILRRIEEQHRSCEAQAQAILAAAEEALKSRVAQLRQTGEGAIDLVERQLAGRLAALRPQTRLALESMTSAAIERVQESIKAAQEMVAGNETQLSARVAEMRPRCVSACQSLAKEMHEQLAKLEAEAMSMTTWLEDRLSQRIDELVQRGRSAMASEITRLEDAAAKIKPLAANIVALPQPQKPEVEIYVSNAAKAPVAA